MLNLNKKTRRTVFIHQTLPHRGNLHPLLNLTNKTGPTVFIHQTVPHRGNTQSNADAYTRQQERRGKGCESKRGTGSVARGNRDDTYMVKHLKEFGTGLMNGADDGPTPAGQFLQQRDALEARGAIQAAATQLPLLSWMVYTCYCSAGRSTLAGQYRHSSGCTRHFSNWCEIYMVLKAAHGNQSDNHCNRSATWSLIVLLELY